MHVCFKEKRQHDGFVRKEQWEKRAKWKCWRKSERENWWEWMLGIHDGTEEYSRSQVKSNVWYLRKCLVGCNRVLMLLVYSIVYTVMDDVLWRTLSPAAARASFAPVAAT